MREIPKKNAEELEGMLWGDPNPGNKYRHNSTNDVYEIVGKSIDCKTNEVRVHYKRINDFKYANILFSRPLADFEEPRFTRVMSYQVYLSHEEHQQYKEIKRV